MTLVVRTRSGQEGSSALGIHLRAVRNTTARMTVFPSRTLTLRRHGTNTHATVRVWCVRGCAMKGVDPIFSATLPLETLRILLSVACQENVFRVKDPFLLSIADVSRVHLYADAVRDVYVRSPDEDPKAKQPGVCVGNCETRCTDLWTQSISLKFGRLEGFPEAWHPRIISSTRTWRLTFWCTVMIFHLGRQEGRECALCLLRGAYELSKVVTLGPGSSQSRTASFLGRTLTLRQWGVEYEPDQQHVSRALKALGLTGAEGVATPETDDVGGPKASQISEWRRMAKWHDLPEAVGEEDDLLTREELKLFQSVAARFYFFATGQARPLVLSERADTKNGFTTYTRSHCPQESCTTHNLIPADDLQISMDPIE